MRSFGYIGKKRNPAGERGRNNVSGFQALSYVHGFVPETRGEF